MGRTFILQVPRRKDISLEALGEYVELLPENNPRPSVFSPDFGRMVLANARSKDFDPEHDYFAIVGSMASMVVAVGAMIKRYGSIRALIYHSSQATYIPVDLGELDEATTS